MKTLLALVLASLSSFSTAHAADSLGLDCVVGAQDPFQRLIIFIKDDGFGVESSIHEGQEYILLLKHSIAVLKEYAETAAGDTQVTERVLTAGEFSVEYGMKFTFTDLTANRSYACTPFAPIEPKPSVSRSN